MATIHLPVFGRVNYVWLPLAASALLLTGIVVPYCIAVRLGHVYPVLPFISDTGALHPESCIFGLLLNMSSPLMVVIVYLRYRQIADTCRDCPEAPDVLLWNEVSVRLAYLSAAGMSVLANFQLNLEDEWSVQTNVHDAGTAVCFACGVLYGFIQSWITYKSDAESWYRVVAALRLALSLFATVFLVANLEFKQLSYAEFNGTYAETLQWNPHDGGYAYHVVSSASEYLLAFSFIVFILTLCKEFQSIKPENESAGVNVKGHQVVSFRKHGPLDKFTLPVDAKIGA